jgi:glyoxylase-like metal-dependent hydrolase (beta-lactamase superfamily II)
MSEYAVHAIRYAQTQRRASENFLGGDPHDGPMPMDFFVWAIIGEGRCFILDTGFDEPMARLRSRRILRPVAEGLKALGIVPEAVDDVIISHMHYDHAGNDGLFPRARFHLQDAEMRFCTGRCMCHGALRHPYAVDDVTSMVRRVFEGRVTFHDGTSEIAPGITVHHVGGHSQGLQVVRVRTRRGWVVLASDASHYYANMEQGRAFPIVHNLADTLEGYDMLRRLADSPDHIVPGHDPLVLTRYAPSLAGLQDIVRLDTEPAAHIRS